MTENQKNKNSKIKIGLINFTNCLPVNYTFEKLQPENIEFLYGNPVQLNKLMSEGKIDIAPVSSFEYLKNKHKYTLLEKACISSDGECGSVILFCKKEFHKLNNGKIAIPNDSASSSAMLKILLNENDINLRSITFTMHDYAENPGQFLDSGFDAVLFIGDSALKANYAFDKPFFTYDIGKLWKNLTGYPAVFGIWVVRNNQLIDEKINNLIPKVIETGFKMYFNEILNKASKNIGLKKEIIEDYLTSKIKYSYTPEHKKSLELFEKLYNKIR